MSTTDGLLSTNDVIARIHALALEGLGDLREFRPTDDPIIASIWELILLETDTPLESQPFSAVYRIIEQAIARGEQA